VIDSVITDCGRQRVPASVMCRRRWTALVASVVMAAGMSAAAAQASGSTFPILVMGDSYSAGNGAGGYVGPNGCYRSPNDYAALYADALERPPYNQPAPLTNVACSGATTSAFFTSQRGQPPQIYAVNNGYGLILLTVGGDNVHFVDIVTQCLVYGARDARKCSGYLSAAEKQLDNGTLETSVRHVLSEIHKKASPSATIALLGYPYLEKDERFTLPYPHHRPVAVGRRLRALENKGDTVQQRVVTQLNAEEHTSSFVFVKTKRLFAGHELSAGEPSPDPWFVPPLLSTFSYQTWYHPNPTGWAEEAKHLLEDPSIPKHGPAAPTPALPAYGPVPLSKLCENHEVQSHAVNGCPDSGTSQIGFDAFERVILIEDNDESVLPKYWNLFDFPATSCSSIILTFAMPTEDSQPGDTASIQVTAQPLPPQSATIGYGQLGQLEATLDGHPWSLENSASNTDDKIAINGVASCSTPSGH
jgi:hypothetical protein